MRPQGRTKNESRSLQRESGPMSPQGRTKGECRSAHRAGGPASTATVTVVFASPRAQEVIAVTLATPATVADALYRFGFALNSTNVDNARMPNFRRVVRGVLCALFIYGAIGAGHPARAQDAPRGLVDTASGAFKDAASSAWHTAQALSSHALGLLGVEYKRGGNSPETGLDCSGLVRYVFQQVTGLNLPRTAKEMSQVGAAVPLGDLKPGDLVFFNTQRFAFSHVGIYLGDNQFIHAPRRGREVQISALDRRYWQARFDGARRLVGVLPEIVPSLVGEAQAAPDLRAAAEPADTEVRPQP